MVSAARFLAIILFVLAYSHASLASGIPVSEWSDQERQWVTEARALYQKQGLTFTDVQAGVAISEMRAKAAPKRGIPLSEWTDQEKSAIAFLRTQYERAGTPLTSEQEQIAIENMRKRMAQQRSNMSMIQGMLAAKAAADSGAPAQAERPVAGAITEEHMGNVLAQFPEKTTSLEIRSRRDGFDVNGQPFIDPEGRINRYAFNVLTGNATYVAQAGPQYVIKTTRLGTAVDPVRIATATRNSSGAWEVTSVTGKRLVGDSLFPVPNGLLVTREAAAFYYQPGKGIRNIAPPAGYRIARIQRGDVGSTGYVLLEKEGAEGDPRSAEGIANTVKDFGRIFGLTTKEDYALMHVDTGKLHSLNIQVDGKMVTQMQNCRRRNALVNECTDAVSYESLYRTDGGPNMSHYFWKVYWMDTPQGPIAITMENGFKDIFILDLKTGKKVVAFNRPLGIQSYLVDQHGDGRVAIKAHWMFQTHELADAVAHLNQTGGGGQAISEATAD